LPSVVIFIGQFGVNGGEPVSTSGDGPR